MWQLSFAVLVAVVGLAAAQGYIVPELVLQARSPAGFRAYLPDSCGVELFALHGNVNEPLEVLGGGKLSKDVVRPTAGWWVFEEAALTLHPGDVINYWVYVVHRGLGYRNDNRTWTVNELLDDFEMPQLLDPRLCPESSPGDDGPVKIQAEVTTPEDAIPVATTPDATDTAEEFLSTMPEEVSSTTPKHPEATEGPSAPALTPPPAEPSATKPVVDETGLLPPPPGPVPGDYGGYGPAAAPPFGDPFGPFGGPFRPQQPGPELEICSNPWHFESLPGESKGRRLEKQLAKLQCQLGSLKNRFYQLTRLMEDELLALKKANYEMVRRMSSLESVLRGQPLQWARKR